MFLNKIFILNWSLRCGFLERLKINITLYIFWSCKIRLRSRERWAWDRDSELNSRSRTLVNRWLDRSCLMWWYYISTRNLSSQSHTWLRREQPSHLGKSWRQHAHTFLFFPFVRFGAINQVACSFRLIYSEIRYNLSPN